MEIVQDNLLKFYFGKFDIEEILLFCCTAATLILAKTLDPDSLYKMVVYWDISIFSRTF